MRQMPDRFWERVRVVVPHARVPVVSVPEPLRGARLSVGWRSVGAVALVVVVALGVFGVRLALARAKAEPVAVSSTPAGLVSRTVPTAFVGDGARAGPLPTGSARPSGPVQEVVVHVVGQVLRPGLVTVPVGARVADAVAAAGGPVRGADLAAINLARLVSDGEQIRVPAPGEVVTGLGAPGGAGAAAPSTVVDLNTATLADLDSLPGIGPVLAQRVLDWRFEHGRFTTVDELGEVAGIGDRMLSQLRAKVRV
jgi:competence protein ComEA